MISLEREMKVVSKEKEYLCRGIMIPSGILHTADTQNGSVLVFMFDNTTNIAKQITQINTLANEAVDKIVELYYQFENSNKSISKYNKFVNVVFELSGINASGCSVTDERIIAAMAYINLRIGGEISCGEVADAVFLSQGRFSHLFKEQVGMTFSAYVIYQRINKAYTEIVKGKSITEAALAAGFSSSAHFAEINKRLFGFSARNITQKLSFIKIK